MKGYKMLSNLKKLESLFASLDDTNKNITDLEAETSKLRVSINSKLELIENLKKETEKFSDELFSLEKISTLYKVEKISKYDNTTCIIEKLMEDIVNNDILIRKIRKEIISKKLDIKDLNEKIKISRFRSYDIKDEILTISSLLIK